MKYYDKEKNVLPAHACFTRVYYVICMYRKKSEEVLILLFTGNYVTSLLSTTFLTFPRHRTRPNQ